MSAAHNPTPPAQPAASYSRDATNPNPARTIKLSKPLLILAITILCGRSSASDETRTWTSTDGKAIEASIVSATDQDVVLKLAGSEKTYTVPIIRLIVGDGARISQWRAQQEKQQSKTLENWDSPWPDLISGEVTLDIETVKEDEQKRQFVYRSPHYEYVSDVKLSQNVVRRFAILFEATNEFCRALPLSMEKAHQKERHLIMLFETEKSYYMNGGPPGSAGVYMSGKDVIMVPLTSLGVISSAGGYRVDYDDTNKTLPHEIVHQLTDPPYFNTGSRGWFTEGLAEYVAVTPYRSGKFNLRSNQNAFKDYVIGYGRDGTGGRGLGDQIKLPRLKDFFLQDYKSFVANTQLSYGTGLLLAHYFFHWDGDGNATNIKNFLKALKQGKKDEQALDVLLAGRTYQELEEQFAKAWRSRGIRIEFP